MSTGNPLPNLPPLAPSGNSGGLSVGRIALSTLTGGASEILGKATGTNFSIQSVVVIIIGLLLIAAGIFSFREVRQTVIQTGTTAAKAAAL